MFTQQWVLRTTTDLSVSLTVCVSLSVSRVSITIGNNYGFLNKFITIHYSSTIMVGKLHHPLTVCESTKLKAIDVLELQMPRSVVWVDGSRRTTKIPRPLEVLKSNRDLCWMQQWCQLRMISATCIHIQICENPCHNGPIFTQVYSWFYTWKQSMLFKMADTTTGRLASIMRMS